ncbi:hypothetical protein [Staphylococcus aureus]|uniref:hypothetical protein n=1 Tax=Staphylococcus aureus TaxID=1280 RepID=UPI001244C246|nr:hypothetical protein [Staphylococcus aureus]
MSNIEAVYYMLTLLITLPIFFTIFIAIKLVLKVLNLHRYKRWYHKKVLIKTLLLLLISGFLFLFTLNIHGTGTPPSKAHDLAQEAFAAMSTSIMIYRTAFMYMVITPLFLIFVYFLYKAVYILVNLQKQKKDTSENQLLKSIATGNSLQISNKFETYINNHENKETTRFSYSDDTFILKCLNKNKKNVLATQLANIIEHKQKHRKYSMKDNKQYMGDKI